MQDLQFEVREVDGWRLPVIRIVDADMEIAASARRVIGNSVYGSPSGKLNLARWKVAVAKAVISQRGSMELSGPRSFAVTVGFSFYPPAHGNGEFDIENFLKPTLDAVAGGLFEENMEIIWNDVTRWHYNDSVFHSLLVHRLQDADFHDAEGAAIFVSARKTK
ncbi:MAG: hypothetical protein AB7G28_08280 [Pirellulales bacterium]